MAGGNFLGAPSGGGSGGFNSGYAGLAAAGGLGLLAALSSPTGDDANKTLSKSGLDLLKMGKQAAGQGTDALTDALKYFQKLSSGDRTEIDNILAPERGRILDQYDAARKQIGTFSPRGGGQTSAMATLATGQARDLNQLPYQARKDAASAEASIGNSLFSGGVSATSSGNSALSEVFQQKQQQDQQTSQLYSSIAEIAMMAAFAI